MDTLLGGADPRLLQLAYNAGATAAPPTRSAAAAVAALLLMLACRPTAAATPTAGSVTMESMRGAALNAQGLPLLMPTNYTQLGRAVLFELPAGKPRSVLALFHG